MTVRLTLFGAPAIAAGAEPMALAFERRSQLLVFLALKRAWVGRAELASMFWPEQAHKLALTNLRKILFRMQTLPWAGSVEAQDGAVRFTAETDVSGFEGALADGRIADALALRRGELLAGFDDDANEAWTSWISFERERLRVAWRGAALERLAADIEPAAAIELAAQLLAADPLDEAALRAQMRCLATSGQHARARQAYREFVARLADDLGLEPGAELKALHDSLSATGIGRAAAGPPAAPASGAFDDGFVGRAAELRRIAALLDDNACRLVTIIGPGGAGKTRLAQRALHEFAPKFADDAVFVGLEDVDNAGEFGARLAAELDVTLAGSREPLDQAIDFLRGREMLLVLDNFEQLAGDARVLSRVFTACAGVKTIVTSRVRLGLPAEWLLPLEGLPCPEPEDQDRLESFDAPRLFINAARRVEPAMLPAVEAAAIVEICREVEGFPLALELAAAWTRVLSCEAIAAELRQGAELLRATDPTQPARHASVEVVFDHSWRLLTAVERDALARLSVFRGGFSFEAARAVTGAPIPVLGALADKSLLRKEATRLGFHPMVQQLAALRLDSETARAATERAHAQHFHQLLTQLRRKIENGEHEALARVDVEYENCRVAWRWAVSHGATDMLAGSAPALFYFCDLQHRFEQGIALLADARASAAAEASPALAATLAGEHAHLEYRLDRYAAAKRTATMALATAEGVDDAISRSLCYQVLGSCALRLGQPAEASLFYARARDHAQAGSDPRKAAANLHNQAVAEKALGNYDKALKLSLQTLAQQQRLGDVAGEALSLNSLGLLYFNRQDYGAAAEHLQAGLAISDRHGLPGARLYALANLTELMVHTNQIDQARRYAERGLETAAANGNRMIESVLLLQVVRIALQGDDLTEARANLGASLQIAVGAGRPDLLIEGVVCFAEILAKLDDPAGARRVLEFAAGHAAIGAPQLDAIRARLAELPAPLPGAAGWAGMSIEELVHRIIVETGVLHAPLIAALRGNA